MRALTRITPQGLRSRIASISVHPAVHSSTTVTAVASALRNPVDENPGSLRRNVVLPFGSFEERDIEESGGSLCVERRAEADFRRHQSTVGSLIEESSRPSFLHNRDGAFRGVYRALGSFEERFGARASGPPYNRAVSEFDRASRLAILSQDTSADVERLQIEAWRRMSPVEKAGIVSQATHDALMLALSGIRQRYPGAPARECFLRLAAILLGPTLVRQVYPEAAEILGPPV